MSLTIAIDFRTPGCWVFFVAWKVQFPDVSLYSPVFRNLILKPGRQQSYSDLQSQVLDRAP